MPGRTSPIPPSVDSAAPFAELTEAVTRAERQTAAAEHARDTAEQASALKTRLLAFASHDLKSPLSSLRATCPLLDAAANDPEEVRALASLMQAEVNRMTRLVHDLLDRTALDEGGLKFSPGPVDLLELVERVAAEFALAARLKQQTITLLRPGQPLPLVSGEASRIDRILANLVDNAVKYSPVDGLITLALGQDSRGAWCSVEDTGPGIAPADRERIFEPYERLGANNRGGESSHGLGLALARELATLHGGTLAVEAGSGPGARFTLALPVSTAVRFSPAGPRAF